MSSSDTRRTARAYFDGWTTRKGADALRALMSPDFVFNVGGHLIEGRDAFLGLAAWPETAETTMLAEAYDGEHAFQLYGAVNGDASVKIAEHLTVREGVIVSSEIVVDGAAFGAFMAGGPASTAP